uniref:Copper transport protein n=1 Tax=Macrostomum lignano TaxID=282301 RepID=A0A1I8HLD0_9PLAT
MSSQKFLLVYALSRICKSGFAVDSVVIAGNQIILTGKLRLIYLAADSLLQLIRVSLSALLMYCAMSYNAAVLLSIVLGSTIGYFLSQWKKHRLPAFMEAFSIDCEAR